MIDDRSSVRSFRNADLPGLLRTYRGHWSAVGVNASVNASIIERAFLSRSDFDPSHLLVAIAESKIVGWSCLRVVNSDAGEAELISLCFAGERAAEGGDRLLAAAERLAADLGAAQLRVGSIDAPGSGLYGLSPHGGGWGVPICDTPTSSLLSRRAFRVDRELVRWMVDPTTFRLPVDRDLLMLRRSTRIEHQAMLPVDPGLAAATSHLDLLRHRLIRHGDGEVLAEIDVWLSDLEVALMEGSRAMIDTRLTPAGPLGQTPAALTAVPTGCSTADRDEGHRRFLIGSVVQTLATRSIFHVEANVVADSHESNQLYAPLNFNITERGRVWVKDLLS